MRKAGKQERRNTDILNFSSRFSAYLIHFVSASIDGFPLAAVFAAAAAWAAAQSPAGRR
jgi:hypothetical protein